MYQQYQGSVLKLLDHLDTNSLEIKNKMISISGKNEKGEFFMELPIFSQKSKLNKNNIKEYIQEFKKHLKG